MYYTDQYYSDKETCEQRLYNIHMAGHKRYKLLLFNVARCGIPDVYNAYCNTEAETIEEIIKELGHFISEMIIFYPAVIFDNFKKLREQEIGFEDVATGGYTSYKIGDLIDAYVKKLVVDSIPVFDDFAIGEEVNGKR